MDAFGIVFMWVIAALAMIVINNDRYGKIVKLREKYWSKFR
jgi:hypothetical protein